MMLKTFITTFNKRLYDDYAHHFINTYLKTKQIIPLICYVEEDSSNYPQHENIQYLNLFEVMPTCKEFVKRHKDKIWIDDKNFLQNAVRFSYKVFAQTHAKRLGFKTIFLDADNIFLKTISEEWFDEFLPDDVFTTFYGRPNYTECGVLGFNNTLNEVRDAFFEKYISYYEKDLIYKLRDKTDCHAFDETRKSMQSFEGYKEMNRGDNLGGHVIARDKMVHDYLDHKKGKRKYKDHSPEWRNIK